MGVKDFFKVLDQNKIEFGEHGKSVTLEDMKGKNIIIDGNLISWQCATAIRGAQLTDSEGNLTQHLKITLNKVLMFHKFGINQLWIFDNPEQNPRKKETNDKRKKRSGFRLTHQHYEEIKELLLYMGVPVIIAPAGVEAEQYASWMTQRNEIGESAFDYVLTTDSDVMLFGGNMLRQYKKNKKIEYVIFEHDEFMETINMSMDELYIVATAIGNDFYSGIRGIGPKTVYAKTKANKIILDEEQLLSLQQFKLYKDDYVELAEYIEEDYNKEAVIEMLVPRGFKETLLEKNLAKY